MKTIVQKSRGLDLRISIPETVEEFDQIAKKPGACLEEAIANSIYRSVLQKIWSEAEKQIPEKFEFPRNVTGTTTKKGADGEEVEVDVYETQSEFLGRWKDSFGPDQRLPFVQEIADQVGFDLTASERSKKADKTFYDQADGLIAAVANGESDWATVAGKISARCEAAVFDLDENGNADRDSLASALQTMTMASSIL